MDDWQDMDVYTVLDVLIEPNAVALVVDGNSLMAAIENIELVPTEFFFSQYYESLEERVFKQLSEGQRLNKLIPEKNVEGFLPKSVGAYMNAAEDFASEAEAAPGKACKYTDAAGGRHTAAVAGTKRKQQTAGSSSKPKCPGCGSFDHAYVFIGSSLTSIRIPRLSSLNP